MPDVEVRITGDASGLSAATDQAAGDLGGLGGIASGIMSKLGPVGGALGDIGGALGSIGLAAGPVGAIVGTVASGLFGMAEAAAADADEQARLELAIRNSGAAVGDWQATLDGAIAQGQALAFTDSAVRESMMSLTQATGDVTRAAELNAVAMDIARQQGIPLAQAADAVARAVEGSTGALGRMYPATKTAASGLDAIGIAAGLARGEAVRFGDTTVGKAEAASQSWDELQETIGSAVLPILAELFDALGPIIEALGEIIKALMPILVPAFKAIAGAVRIFADALLFVIRTVKDAIDFIGRLIRMILDAIANIGHFLDSINPLKNFQLPDVLGAISDLNPFAASASMSSTTYVTVNTGADPGQVIGAVRTWADSRGGLRSLDG